MEELKKYIREVPDFPKKGILFYDITTLLESPEGFKMALAAMEKYLREKQVDKILAIESRGFVFGGVLADRLNIPMVLARKPGKLPHKSISEEYALEYEYGTDSLEMHEGTIAAGERVAIVDDLIATGGTLKAVCKLVERLGGEVVAISAVIALTFLPFEQALQGYDVNYLVSYDSE
jgi:adenine phosphoribosyltransferase